jgi:ankyrin repeat protein
MNWPFSITLNLCMSYALPERWADAAMWTKTREDVVNWQFLMARRVELNRLVKSIQQRPNQGHQELRELTAIALRVEERDLRTAVRTQDRLMDEQARFDPLRRGAANLSQVDLWYRKTRKQIIWNQIVRTRELQRAIAAKEDMRHHMPAIRPTAFPPTNAMSLKAAHRSPGILDQLISEDCHEALTMLRRLGIFNPIGYTRMGHSYLHHALTKKAFRVARMICSLYTPQDWASSSIISDITPCHCCDENAGQVHRNIELLAEHKWANQFDRAFFNLVLPWWVQQQNHPDALLRAHTRRMICTFASRDLANRLLAAGIDLSQTPTIAVACGGLNSVTTGGTPWHLAATNRDITFLDFLDNRIHDHIFTPDFNNRLPLDIAMMNDNYEAAQRLIQLGHSLREPMYNLLRTLPSSNDRYFQLLLSEFGANINTIHRKSIHAIYGNMSFAKFGPLLHDVVRVVHTVNAPLQAKVAALRQWGIANRRKVIRQTKPISAAIAANTNKGIHLIEAIKRGNGVAQGDVQAVDYTDRTASNLAETLGVSASIINLL